MFLPNIICVALVYLISEDFLNLSTFVSVMSLTVFTDTDCHSDVTTVTEEADFHHVCEAFLASVGLGPCTLVVDGIDEIGGTYMQTPQQV